MKHDAPTTPTSSILPFSHALSLEGIMVLLSEQVDVIVESWSKLKKGSVSPLSECPF